MSETIRNGETALIDPHDARLFTFDYDTLGNLDVGATIVSSRFEIRGVRPAGSTIASITRSGTTATVTTDDDHGLATGDQVTVAGAAVADYNVTATVTITGTRTFTYTVANAPTTPAAADTGDAMTWSQGLGKDQESILSAAEFGSRYTQLRLTAGGPEFLGRRYEIVNRIVTSTSPTETKERSFFAVIENL